jgi:hypothetical protein
VERAGIEPVTSRPAKPRPGANRRSSPTSFRKVRPIEERVVVPPRRYSDQPRTWPFQTQMPLIKSVAQRVYEVRKSSAPKSRSIPRSLCAEARLQLGRGRSAYAQKTAGLARTGGCVEEKQRLLGLSAHSRRLFPPLTSKQERGSAFPVVRRREGGAGFGVLKVSRWLRRGFLRWW